MSDEQDEATLGNRDSEDLPNGSPPKRSALRLVMSDGDQRRPIAYRRQVEQRMSALFDDVEVVDTYITRPGRRRTFTTKSGSGSGIWRSGADSGLRPGLFNLVPREFLQRARTRAPEAPESTASSFASWVYSLYGVPGTNDEDLERGIEGEKLLSRFGEDSRYDSRRGWVDTSPSRLSSRGDGWRLMHQGLHLTEKPIDYFVLDGLHVGGIPMRLSPDLVYQNQRTGEVRIIEIKLSRLPVPTNLWPNVWAQLWCYSHIPLALNAPNVVIAGEVWGDWMSRISKDRNLVRFVGLRSVVRRDPRAPSYDRFFRELFKIYGGQCAE